MIIPLGAQIFEALKGGHDGGVLVHEFGVTALAKAPMTTPGQVLQSHGAAIDRD